MKYTKRMAAAALTGAMALSLTACGGNGQNAAGSDNSGAAEPANVTICLDWTPNTNHTGLYVAAAKGYYEDAGLNVSIVQPPEDGATAICAAGQGEFAVTVQDPWPLLLRGRIPLG